MLLNCVRQLVTQAPDFASRVVSTVEVSAALSRRYALTSPINDVMLQHSSSVDDCIVCVVTSQVDTHTLGRHDVCRQVRSGDDASDAARTYTDPEFLLASSDFLLARAPAKSRSRLARSRGASVTSSVSPVTSSTKKQTNITVISTAFVTVRC